MHGNRPKIVTIDDQAVHHLVDFCQQEQITRLLMVADANTYAAQGKAVEEALRGMGADLKCVLFGEGEVVADAAHILDVLVAAGNEDRVYVAVGSGTITDITRFASHRTKSNFISIPTAPSVDGFASIGAPLILHGVKITVIAQAPIAIFADSNTLSSAPPAMIAAGFGDMLGKATSIGDWRIGHLLWNEPYDEAIAQRTLSAVQLCVDAAPDLGQARPEGVRILMDALIESGYCMLDFGTSRPASGAEHHYSHFWEMKLLREGRPAILHGAKVGVATVEVARIYDRTRRLSRQEVSDLLEASTLPTREDEVGRIRAAYGEQTDEIIAGHLAFLNLSEADYDDLKQKVLAHWDEIQAIAAEVPPAEEIAALLQTVGGPSSVAELGLSDEELNLAVGNGHYLRDRFTSRKLARVLGLEIGE
jgi:glycerol-1-phosphate dehydrogenase [NAD(P)+]